eukprot:gene57-4306_t
MLKKRSGLLMPKLFIFIVLFLSVKSDLTALKTLLDNKEVLSEKLCTNLKAFHGAYDPNSGSSCQYLDSCSDNLETDGSLQCGVGFGADSDCSCSQQTSKINLLRASVIFSPKSDKNDEELKEFLCSTVQINNVFTQNYAADNKVKWQYIGSEHGGALFWPAHRWKYRLDSTSGCNQPGTCPDYDARFRPWYVSAASGPKKVVLLLDISGSMSNLGRIESAKSAAISIIDGLSHTDYISIIFFSTAAQDCVLAGNGKLVEANAVNRILLKQCVNNIVPAGSTNFEAAFTTAFDVLDATAAIGPKCHHSILFLTDGAQTDGKHPLDLINTRNINYKANIFSYSFGSEADKTVPTQLACATNGLWKQIKDSGDLRSQMAEYYNYYAYDIKQTRKSVWSELYQDFSLNITMATSASPCFATYGKLLGVSGVDTPLSDLLAIHNDENAIRSELKSRSAVCADFELDKDNLATLRGGKCNYCTPCAGTTSIGEVIGIFAGITGGGFFVVCVLPIILLGLCFCVCCCICGAPLFGFGKKKKLPSKHQNYKAPSTTNTQPMSRAQQYEMELVNSESQNQGTYVPPNPQPYVQPSYNPQFVQPNYNQPNFNQPNNGNQYNPQIYSEGQNFNSNPNQVNDESFDPFVPNMDFVPKNNE